MQKKRIEQTNERNVIYKSCNNTEVTNEQEHKSPQLSKKQKLCTIEIYLEL